MSSLITAVGTLSSITYFLKAHAFTTIWISLKAIQKSIHVHVNISMYAVTCVNDRVGVDLKIIWFSSLGFDRPLIKLKNLFNICLKGYLFRIP